MDGDRSVFSEIPQGEVNESGGGGTPVQIEQWALGIEAWDVEAKERKGGTGLCYG